MGVGPMMNMDRFIFSDIAESKAAQIHTSEASMRVDVQLTVVTTTGRDTRAESGKVTATSTEKSKETVSAATASGGRSEAATTVRNGTSLTSTTTGQKSVTATVSAPNQTALPSGSGAGSGVFVGGNPFFGLLVAVALAFGILL
ncbi:hypothetical protein AA313_de0209896 [Arthrobotrys entomopaga]|nr:hypothetical protein AA313_de0209896 [Arthrobotrys entomopaga]